MQILEIGINIRAGFANRPSRPWPRAHQIWGPTETNLPREIILSVYSWILGPSALGACWIMGSWDLVLYKCTIRHCLGPLIWEWGLSWTMGFSVLGSQLVYGAVLVPSAFWIMGPIFGPTLDQGPLCLRPFFFI